jgi:cell division GTPase FtsZ
MQKEEALSEEELTHIRSDQNQSPRISIVGIGGAGNKLLANVIDSGGIGPEQCIAVNTDKGQLSRSLAGNKVLLGEDIVDGRGVFGSVSVGRRALQLSAHRVTSFVDASDMTIILVGFGGGTGTAAAPLVAQWARTQVKPVVAVVALPFTHERERRFIAIRGLKKMADACDCTVVVDNAMSLDGNDVEGRMADVTAVAAVRSLTEALSNLDLEAARNILRILVLGPLCSVYTCHRRPDENLSTAIVEALRTPSSNLPLSKAQGAVLLYTGPVPIGPSQAARAYDTLSSLTGRSLSFVYGSTVKTASPTLCLLLTGYDYGSSLGSFVELLTDLYDVEYEQPTGGLDAPIPLQLYQLERP